MTRQRVARWLIVLGLAGQIASIVALLIASGARTVPRLTWIGIGIEITGLVWYIAAWVSRTRR